MHPSLLVPSVLLIVGHLIVFLILPSIVEVFLYLTQLVIVLPQLSNLGPGIIPTLLQIMKDQKSGDEFYISFT